jgi:hypothetical protein
MIRKTSIKNCTTDSSSTTKKKKKIPSGFSSMTHVSLVNKSGILNKVLNTPKDSVSGNGAFFTFSNNTEMSEISTNSLVERLEKKYKIENLVFIDKSVVTHGRSHADGMRQHVQKSNKAGKVVIVNGVETIQHTLFGGRKN